MKIDMLIAKLERKCPWSGIIRKNHWRDSNTQPSDYRSDVLPTELQRDSHGEPRHYRHWLSSCLFTLDIRLASAPSICPIHIRRYVQYNTRLASKNAYYIPKIRTNYGKFNIRFTGVKIWNSIQENFKTEKIIKFKKLVKDSILNSYSDIWCTLLPICPSSLNFVSVVVVVIFSVLFFNVKLFIHFVILAISVLSLIYIFR